MSKLHISNLDSSKIYNLKIIAIYSFGMEVQAKSGIKGFIKISEITDLFVADISKLYTKNDQVFGYLIKQKGDKNYFSLKAGHSATIYLKKRNKIDESGGGFLGLKYSEKKILNKGWNND